MSLSIMTIGIIAFNINKNENSASSQDLSLKNIASLQASAGEKYCDQKTYTSCTISVNVGGTWVTGYSIGNIKED